jgi:lipopolysaccharide/colanic/teichoic acid biosynthesis glycosyltransferase
MNIQRFLDLIFSALAIVFLSPILLTIVLILSVTGEREVFYRQQRVGINQTSFDLLKFATMLKNSENIGAGTVTLKNDFRVLPLGKFLRKTKLNELPQLFNIALGHMSIIGPRPLHKKQFSFYNENQKKIISSVLPGLSGMGSVVFRDEEKYFQDSNDPDEAYKTHITPVKAKLEIWYVNNNSIYLYFKLIALTIVSVLIPSIDAARFFENGLDEQ